MALRMSASYTNDGGSAGSSSSCSSTDALTASTTIVIVAFANVRTQYQIICEADGGTQVQLRHVRGKVAGMYMGTSGSQEEWCLLGGYAVCLL
jgi:hypothetical protein